MRNDPKIQPAPLVFRLYLSSRSLTRFLAISLEPAIAVSIRRLVIR